MLVHARWLFGSAALFNGVIALGMFFFSPLLAPLLDLSPAEGSNLAMSDLALVLIATFGMAYLCVAINPQRFRSYICLGVLGKGLVVLVIYGHWLAGNISFPLPVLASGDLVYALLFIIFLCRYRTQDGVREEKL